MLNWQRFANRTSAGEQLALKIKTILDQRAIAVGKKLVPIVYALPRGGLPVALPVARLLHCPLTVMVAKKISHPHNPELAIGAVTATGEVLWMQQKWRWQQNSQLREAALISAMNKAKSQEAQFSPACPQVDAQGAIAILVDDGIATGMTMAVAAKALRKLAPAEIWLCTPVAPLTLLDWLSQWGDRVIVLETPADFFSVSNFYAEFPQVETKAALVCLQQQYEWK